MQPTLLKQILRALAISGVLATVLTTGCSGGGGSNPNPPASIAVSISTQPASSVSVGGTTTLAAAVSNDSSNAGVAWALSCGSAQCGTVSPSATASGAQATYTAPAAVPSSGTVTLTATSVADKTKTASTMVTVTAQQAIAVALSTPAPSALTAGSSTALAAVVTNDPKNAGVMWSVTCGNAQCGSFSTTSTASGAQTSYTAPANVPAPNTVTIQATSVTDTTKSVSATVTITPANSAVLSDGNYVYHLTGQDANGTYYVAGVITVKGGDIVGGEQDFVDPAFQASDTIAASGSGLSTTTGNIQIVLATSDTNVGVNGVVTLRGTVVSPSHVAISEFDPSAAATGSLDVQNTISPPAAGYAFVLNGLDDQNPSNQLAIGGVLNFNDGNLVTTGSVFDYNDGGSVGQAKPFVSGTVTAPDAYGRVVMTLTPDASTSVPGFVLVGYLGANKIQLIESQQDALGATLGGVALSQGKATGTFTPASISGTSYAYGVTGEDQLPGETSPGLVNIAGGFGFNADGSLGGKLTLNDLVFHRGNSITAGTYAVDPTGRVTLSNVLADSLGNTFTFQLYLDGNGNGVVIGADTLQASGGLAYLQSAPSAEFNGSYALSGQGFLNNPGASPWAAVGPVTVSSDTFSGYTDYTVQGSTPASSVQLTGTENTSNGVLNLTGLNALSFSGSTAFGYYPIDNTRVLAIGVDDGQLALILLEGTNP